MTAGKTMAVGAAALVLGAGFVTMAAGSDTSQDPVERWCGDRHPCTIVSGFATREANGEEPWLMTPETALARYARPVGECPAAVAAYVAAGTDPDVIVGPCPAPENWPGKGDAGPAHVLDQMARAALEQGSE